MLGIIQAILSAGIIANDKMNRASRDFDSRVSARNSNDRYYRDSYGKLRDLSTNKEIKTIPQSSFHYYVFDTIVISKERAAFRGYISPKKLVYGVIDVNIYRLKEWQTYEKECLVPRWEIKMGELNLFEEFFENLKDAKDYCRQKYGDKFSDYIAIINLYIPKDRDVIEYFEQNKNKKGTIDSETIDKIQHITVNGKDEIKGVYEIKERIRNLEYPERDKYHFVKNND